MFPPNESPAHWCHKRSWSNLHATKHLINHFQVGTFWPSYIWEKPTFLLWNDLTRSSQPVATLTRSHAWGLMGDELDEYESWGGILGDEGQWEGCVPNTACSNKFYNPIFIYYLPTLGVFSPSKPPDLRVCSLPGLLSLASSKLRLSMYFTLTGVFPLFIFMFPIFVPISRSHVAPLARQEVIFTPCQPLELF